MRSDTKQGPGSGFVDRDHDPRTSPTSKAEAVAAPLGSVTPHSRTRVRSRFTTNRRLQECGRWQKDPPCSQKRLLSKTPEVTKLPVTRSR
ncbi:hypothetical protein AV530_001696 [Patagioenas fasciata monilis]|uniref:Uncharacterized protein n=1 Tax=Patagioenas fasciata monilis TaxID=372326 RepID=A0A1V4KLZ8_PATFA|nr:hypothetical protein AV530_001696 [Patagioenas fasciata monilis]